MNVKFFSFLLMLFLGLSLGFTSCSSDDDDDEDKTENIDEESDTVGALKEALLIGAATASTELGKDGGYLNDSIARIALPEEINSFFETIGKLQQSKAGDSLLNIEGISVDDLENTMTTLINKASEEAATKAVNVFKTIIVDMNISDEESILFGENNAATKYLYNNSFYDLQSAFKPTITESLSNVSFDGYNVNQAWETVTTQYGYLMDCESLGGNDAMLELKLVDPDSYNKIINMKSLEIDLADYVTEKALNGLLYKIANKELDIRTNAASRTTDLLKNIFGKLD